MSAKKQPLHPQYSNISFSGYEEAGTFKNIHIDSQNQQHSRERIQVSKYQHLYQDRQNLVPNIHPGLVSPMAALSDGYTIQLLQLEVKRLEEVIFYVGTNNDKLIKKCDQQQKELLQLRSSSQRAKEQFDLDMKKLKETLNEKISECQSVTKNAQRQVTMVEQENQRMKMHIKSVIEKKNDQIFNLNRNKDSEVQIVKKDLEKVIQETKDSWRKQVDRLNTQIGRLQEEIKYWEEKYDRLDKQYQKLDEGFQEEKLHIITQNESNLSELKQKYHRNKLLMLEASQQQVETLEESAGIQRDTYLFEIENLRKHIEILSHDYKEQGQNQSFAQNCYEESLKGYQTIIEELKKKITKIYKIKEQEMEILKIKAGSLQQSNLKAVEGLFNPKIQFLIQKANTLEQQIENLHNILSKQIDRNSELIRKIRIKESQHQEELKNMKSIYDSQEDLIKQRFFTEKSLIMQQSAQIIKNYGMKANSAKFAQQELRKLRKQLDQRITQNYYRQKVFAQEKDLWEEERKKIIHNSRVNQEQLEKEISELKKGIEQKNLAIQNLSNDVVKAIKDSPLPDYRRFVQQIQELKKEVILKNETEKHLKEKADKIEKKCREYRQQSEKLHLENDVIVNQARAEWQVLSQKKSEEMQEFYKRKLDYVQSQRDDQKNINSELQSKITHILERYKELESALSEAMINIQRRSDIERKVMMLGADNNLVKNKQQLFQY